jgi:glycosyltransferase involved in cell wall biosynthesis
LACRPTRLLVATRHNPFPENDGAGAYLFDLLSYLAGHGFEIEVVWLEAEGKIKRRGHWRIPQHFSKVARLQIIGGLRIGHRIFFPRVHWFPFKARRLHEIKTALNALRLGFLLNGRHAQRNSTTGANNHHGPTTLPWSSLPTAEETLFFHERLRAFRPDAILLNYCWLSPLLTGLAELPTAILANDVVSQRLACTPGLVPDPATPEGEADLLARARHILAISEDDAAVFRARLPEHSIIHAPKAAELHTCAKNTTPDRVLFVGGINKFNREGILWFLAETWPFVLSKNPRAQLHICGGIGDSISNVPTGVLLRGRVPDLGSEYAEASVVIVPLLNGSGVKIKLVEAASYGKAIVTTPVGLQGLSFLRSAVVEASLPADFADGVVSLLADAVRRQKLSQAILPQVATHLSHESSYGPVRRALSGSSS